MHHWEDRSHFTYKAWSIVGQWNQHLRFVSSSPSKVLWCSTVFSSKDYWCLKEVAARCLLARSKTSVIIAVLVWCWPSILDILLWYIWMQRLSTSDWVWPASSLYSSYCTWKLRLVCIPIDMSLPVSFSAEHNFTASYFDLYLYINAYE
jgi:hypothetical protein